VVLVLDDAAGQVPRRSECFHKVGDVAVARAVGPFDGEQSQDDDRHAQGRLQVRKDRLDLRPPRVVDGKGPTDPADLPSYVTRAVTVRPIPPV
jgi:hypothetical protein